MIFYAKSTGGFYSSDIHGNSVPADAADITAAHHAALLAGQAEGKRIVPDATGRPMLADQPTPTEAELAALARAKRDAKLAACDWTQLPDAPLAAESKASWAVYRQALRDITGQTAFPASVVWPDEPGGAAA